MKKLTILVDMDDTIEGLLDAWLIWMNAAHGCSVTREDITSWDMTRAYPNVAVNEIYTPLEEPAFWDSVEPIPGASEALQKWLARGHEVFIVTATPYTDIRPKMEKCLFKLFPFLKWENVIITGRKQLLRGDVLIDDGLHNLVDGPYEKILVTAPYNRPYPAEENGMLRVNTWAEIERAVEKLENGERLLPRK